MTVVTGNIQDIGMAPLSGSLEARSAEFRASGDVLIAPEARAFPVVAGAVEADLLPGPVRVTISVGSHARESFDVIVPESGPASLASLVEDAVEWSPQVVSRVAALRDEAVAARDVAVSAAESAAEDAQVVGSAAQDMSAQVSAAEGHADAAAGSASDAASSATGAESSAAAASGSASGAASSASAAEGSADAAASSASAAAGSAQDAASSAADAESSASAAAGSAQSAEQWATSFDVTASSSTLAPGSQATVTVSGEGPAYHLEVGVPQGAKGDPGPKGDDGEVSQAALDAAVASLVDGAPEALNTLTELADALGNDPNFATTVSTQIGERAKTSDVNAALAGKADVGAEDTATWAGVSGKPATFPPTIGSTASTAKAGNYVPAWSEVTGKPSTFTPATHSHTKAEVGLANVDNTSDANKPVSTAVQAALDGKAATGHKHPVSDLTTTGTASSSTYLRGDGTWATPANTTYAVPSQAEAEAGTATTGRAFSAQRVRQAIDAHPRLSAAPATWRWNGTTLPTSAAQVHAQARVGDFIVAPNLTTDPGWHQITGV